MCYKSSKYKKGDKEIYKIFFFCSFLFCFLFVYLKGEEEVNVVVNALLSVVSGLINI